MKDPIKGLLGGDVWGQKWTRRTRAHIEPMEEKCHVCKKTFHYNAVVYPNEAIENESLPDGYWVPDYATSQWVWVCNSCHDKSAVKKHLEVQRWREAGVKWTPETGALITGYYSCPKCRTSKYFSNEKALDRFRRYHHGHGVIYWKDAPDYPLG